MEQIVFELNKVPDAKSKLTELKAYPEIKKRFFELASEIEEGKINIAKFHREVVMPNVPETVNLVYEHTRKWYLKMLRYLIPLLAQIKAQRAVRQEKTLLDKERDKLVKQAEIRQDVTEIMGDYIKSLKDFVEDSEKMKKLTHKEMLELYKVIREEEDRSKTLGLKERAENRADAAFAFFISQARANQLVDEDIEFMEDDIKETLKLYKQDDGTYSLPISKLPKIQLAAKNPAA